jgi:hypothetical protein
MQVAAGLVVALLVAVAAHPLKQLAQAERSTWPEQQEYVILPPPEVAPVLAGGYKEAWADVTWVRALVYYGGGRVGESQFSYLSRFIDTILALDPKFHRVYEWAAYAVTYKAAQATADEFALSIKYLERGIVEFPKDGDLFWLLGLRYWFDVPAQSKAHKRELRARGADMLERAMRTPNANPRWPTMLAEMRTVLGQRDRALRDLREMILTTDNKKARERMLAKYAGIARNLEIADELESAAVRFDTEHKRHLPYAPPDFYVQLGPRPDPVIDFAALATERDLIGAEAEPSWADEDRAAAEPRTR